ncbi:unnamed protein product [Arctogadus glacialis]
MIRRRKLSGPQCDNDDKGWETIQLEARLTWIRDGGCEGLYYHITRPCVDRIVLWTFFLCYAIQGQRSLENNQWVMTERLRRARLIISTSITPALTWHLWHLAVEEPVTLSTLRGARGPYSANGEGCAERGEKGAKRGKVRGVEVSLERSMT